VSQPIVGRYYVYPMLVPREWAGEKRNRLMEILREDHRVETWLASAECRRTRRLFTSRSLWAHRSPTYVPKLHVRYPSDCAVLAQLAPE
jgi:hypothetical protein